METMHTRLKEARINAGYTSASKAAFALNLKPSTYNAHENGQNEFDAELAKTYAKKFKVSAAWLLTGEDDGPRRVPLGHEFDPDPDFEADGAKAFSDHQFVPALPGGRPEIDVMPGAGEGMIGDTRNLTLASGSTITGHRVIAEWVLPEAFYRHELHANPDGSIFMSVIGNSMAPTLWPGDRVIVDTRQNVFGPDAIYVFDDGDGEPRVKSLKKVLGTDEVRVISDNRESYGEDRMSLTALRILGRVVGKISKL
ncbi:S24 family peptidase [Kaistia sp. MMO-174]|uniref:S24 family peptidase n=1 Tax=Kaistia sp. MMO-174 TaxID=3081256 RepID=UPI00301A6490